MAGDTYVLHRGKKTRGIRGRSRGHVVRGRVWGQAATWKPKLREMDRTFMCHMVGNTYLLHRGKQTRGMGGRSRGRVVKRRAWGKEAAGRRGVQEDRTCMIQLAGNTYPLRWSKQTIGIGAGAGDTW